MKSFLEAVSSRRSYYELSGKSPVTDKEILQIIETAVQHVPSAFNSQSTRVVLLLGEKHKQLWDITKEVLRKIVPAEAFGKTESKIDTSFASGYGTLLFYEDQTVVKELQEQFPSYAANFPVWSEQTSGMHQFTLWTALEAVGFGASVQHYNPLIDQRVAEAFGISPDWKLISEMPFGVPLSAPGKKTFKPLAERVLVLK